jgi:carboxyl-terminal processing protease
MLGKNSTPVTVFIAALLMVLGGVIGYRVGQSQEATGSAFKPSDLAGLMGAQPSELKNVKFDTFWEVWKLLERDYLETDRLKQDTMVHGAIAGLTSALGDPYTVYLPPEDNKRSAEDLAGAFYGVGIELGYIDNTLAVIAPVAGTPAEKAGIKTGDLILHVKDPQKNLDEDTTEWSLVEAVDKIRGPKGTQVALTLLRKDHAENQPFVVSVERGEIVVKSVDLSFEEHASKRVAHIKLSRFGERTQAEWDEVVAKILAEKGQVDGVILDMRNNPGGFFDGAIDVASEFIEDGVVVSQKDKVTSKEFKAIGDARLEKYPVEVLVNKGSASASEIVAGALRDQKEAKLIGEKTFGKGTVQDRRELNNGGGIHITVARWMLPKGDWIHDEGIPVNIEVKDVPETPQDEVMQRAIEEI